MKKIIYLIIFLLVVGLTIAAGYNFTTKHQEDKEKCNIDSSFCKLIYICPSEDNYCESVNDDKYHVFLECEFYTGTYNEAQGYCDFYNKNFTRNYPLDITDYDKESYDQLKESIKSDIKVIIETEQTEEARDYDDKSSYKDRRYNRGGEESQEK